MQRNRTNWIYWIAAAAIAVVVVGVYFRGGGDRPGGPAGLVGQQAPSFAVPKLGGGEAGLADYRGRIVVMNLWASWCPPCRAEMPDLERLYLAYRSRGVVVLGVDQGESAERTQRFAQSLGITYPILLDQDQRYGRVYAALGLPTTLIVDRRGVVVKGFDGALSYEQMTAAVAPVLGTR